MATTDVDVCNLSLASLGLDPISSLSDTTQEARTCNSFYSLMRDNYLTEHDWSFAEKILELTEIDPLPDGYEQFDYGYEYPSDCLKARAIVDGETKLEWPFIIQNRVIAGPANEKFLLTDLADAYLRYTVALEDPDLFSATFLNAFSKKLAFEISWPLTKDAKVQKQAFDQFALADNFAKQKDSSEQLPVTPPPTWFQTRGLGEYDPVIPYYP